MQPKTLQTNGSPGGLGSGQQDSLDDTTEVSQIEEVVRLLGRWQKVQRGLLVDFVSCID